MPETASLSEEALPLRRQPLRPAEKLRLAGEIVAVYWRAKVELSRQARVRDALEVLRGKVPDASTYEKPTHLRAVRLGRAVRRTLRALPTDSRCLIQSVVLTALLARRGIASSMVIAVRPGDTFRAHAWVEYCGHPVLPPTEKSFHRLTEV